MAVFPEFPDDELEEFAPDEDLNLDVDVQPPTPYGTTWKFDFDNGDIFLTDTGETVKLAEMDTVKEWIKHTLSIRRFETPIYGTDIGTDIHDMLGGKDQAFVKARIEQEVVEAVVAHDRITSAEVTDLFVIGHVVYVLLEFVTDDSDAEDLLVSVG